MEQISAGAEWGLHCELFCDLGKEVNGMGVDIVREGVVSSSQSPTPTDTWVTTCVYATDACMPLLVVYVYKSGYAFVRVRTSLRNVVLISANFSNFLIFLANSYVHVCANTATI